MFNLALAIAIANGVTIAWWRKALRGATVKELHRSWAFSTSTFELATAGKAFNVIALCALTAKFALLDGIFLQQASGTEPGFWDEFNVQGFRFPVVKELPSDFLGDFSTDARTGAYSRNLSAALFNYYLDPNLIAFEQVFVTDVMDKRFDTKCIGRCDFNVSGFGLQVQCTQQDSLLSDISPATLATSNGTSGASTLVDVSFTPNFGTGNDTSSADPSIDMHVEYAVNTVKDADATATAESATSSTNTDCQGSLTRQTCTIRPAIVNYHIYISNASSTSVGGSQNGIRIDQPIIQDTTTGFTSPVYMDEIQPLQVQSALTLAPTSRTMQAIYKLLNSTYTTHISQSYSSSSSGFSIGTGTGQMGAWWGKLQSIEAFPSDCAITMVDPSQWIITQLNNIVFRVAVAAATDRNVSSETYMVPYADDIQDNLVGNQTRDTVVYTSNYSWMGGAVAIMVLCILCVLPVYWGFWELGRKVTLGPMEIASAFQAPVLSHPSRATAAGGEVKTLLKEVGARQVRYGEVGGQLVVAEAAVTRGLLGPAIAAGTTAAARHE